MWTVSYKHIRIYLFPSIVITYTATTFEIAIKQHISCIQTVVAFHEIEPLLVFGPILPRCPRFMPPIHGHGRLSEKKEDQEVFPFLYLCPFQALRIPAFVTHGKEKNGTVSCFFAPIIRKIPTHRWTPNKTRQLPYLRCASYIFGAEDYYYRIYVGERVFARGIMKL